METLYWKDDEGNEWREIIYKGFERLDQLKVAYEDRGWKAWLNLWDCTKGKWILTLTRPRGT